MSDTSSSRTTPARSLTILTGASRGLGHAMAQQLLREPGTSLLCISRRSSPALAATARETGATLEQWTLDLANPAAGALQLTAWLDAIDGAAFASATLINNAGVVAPARPLAESDIADVQRALRVGIGAPILLAAAFLRATRDWPCQRKVLNISSGLGRQAMASQAPYCAVKAGLDHFSRALALEQALEPNGARVCSLAPGVIDTDMQRQLRESDPAQFPDRTRFVGLAEAGKLDSPEAAARKVLGYLARPDFGAQPVADVRDAG